MALFLFAGLLVFFVFLMLPPEADFIRCYVQVARDWASGATKLYDEKSVCYYNAPWFMFLMAPLSIFPAQISQALMNMLSLIALLSAIYFLVGPVSITSLALGVAIPFTVYIFLTGQVDGVILFFVGLSWFAIQRNWPYLLGIGLVGIAIRPTNVILSILLLLYVARKMSWLKILIIPTATLFISFWISGIDWPIRYWRYLQATFPPPTAVSVSLWDEFRLLKLPDFIPTILAISFLIIFFLFIKKHSINNLSVALALALNVAISPYSAFYHYIYATPALILIAKKRWVWAIIIWGICLLVLGRMMYSWALPPLYAYPLSIALIFCGLFWRGDHSLRTQQQHIT